jgi:hypothetical protein
MRHGEAVFVDSGAGIALALSGILTLVGIAGEDDLDAPVLDAAPKPAAELSRPGSHPNAFDAPRSM